MYRSLLSASGCAFVTGLTVGAYHEDKVHFAIHGLSQIFSKSIPHEFDNPKFYIEKASKISGSMKYGVLSTIDNGTVVSRTVQPFPVEFDEQGNPLIYFNTSRLTRKVDQMNNCNRVTMTYLNQKDMSCAVYMGTVERVPYPESLKHWEEWLLMFFPEGNNELEGSRFTTWRIRPTTITILSYKEGISSARDDSRPPEVRYNTEKKNWQVICDGRTLN